MRRIYYCLFTILLYLSGHIQTIAQSQPDSTLVEKYLLDFVVPDMPAFKALGTDASNMLRPSDVKKFAAMLTPFYSNRAGIIPKNFAVEFAPWKLASKKWTLNDYNTDRGKRFLYRSSFSIGTITDTTKFPAKLSIGYRVSFLSKRADIYRSAEIRNFFFVNQSPAMVAFVNLTNYWVLNVVQPTPAPADRPTYYSKHRSDFNDFLSTIDQRLKIIQIQLFKVYLTHLSLHAQVFQEVVLLQMMNSRISFKYLASEVISLLKNIKKITGMRAGLTSRLLGLLSHRIHLFLMHNSRCFQHGQLGHCVFIRVANY